MIPSRLLLQVTHQAYAPELATDYDDRTEMAGVLNGLFGAASLPTCSCFCYGNHIHAGGDLVVGCDGYVMGECCTICKGLGSRKSYLVTLIVSLLRCGLAPCLLLACSSRFYDELQ